MIDFIIPVRDRDNKRIQNCINSIKGKSVGRIIVVDYGSSAPVDVDAEIITVSREAYPVWNKAHALNIGIRSSTAHYIGAVDCDIVLPEGFIEKARKKLDQGKFVLSNKVRRVKRFTKFESSLARSTDWKPNVPNYTKAVGGIQLFSREWATRYRGYDEELTYWGGMDTYMYKLAIASGLKVIHLDETILHQEHKLTKEDNLCTYEEKRKAVMERMGRKDKVNELVQKAMKLGEWGVFSNDTSANVPNLAIEYDKDIKISCAIMAHRKRSRQVEVLYNKLIMYPFVDFRIVWDKNDDTWATGARAIRAGVKAKSEYHIVIQDDAIIPKDFYQHVKDAIAYCPTRTLISLYTGTGRPLPSRIKQAVDKAKYCSWLRGSMLYWGVGIVIPTDHIEPVLEYADGREENYDVRTGIFYMRNRLPIFYTNPSLVDHNDNVKSLMNHGQLPGARKAHKFVDGPIDWNKTFIDI